MNRIACLKFLHLGLLMAGILQLGTAVEKQPLTPPPPSDPKVAEIELLMAQFAPPGSAEQVLATRQIFEQASVAQKERLLVGIGTAGMSNCLPLVVEHAGDENAVVALAALRACQDLGPSSVGDLKDVQRALDSADPRVQTRAAILLAHLEDEASLKPLIARLGTVAAPEAKSTCDLLHELSGKDLGETAAPWQTWLNAELSAADAKLPSVLQALASKDSSQVIQALKESTELRLRRAVLVPSVVALLGHGDAQVAHMAELCLKALGGPLAKASFKIWQQEHPLGLPSLQASQIAVTPTVVTPTVAARFHLSEGVQDILVISGLVFLFFLVFVLLGRPTKKALMTLDQATGGHVTRRLVMAKAKGQAVVRNTTTFFKQGAIGLNRPRPRQDKIPAALERKTPPPADVAVSK